LTLNAAQAQCTIATELASYIMSSIPMPDWHGPNEVERWRDSDYKALAQYLDDRPLLRYIIGYFWRYHCDAETWTAMAKYSTRLQGGSVHGWCLLEGWLPFGTREGAQDISVLSIFGPEPQSLLRFKRWLASGTGGRRDATYFSADAENNFPSLVSSGLFQICGETNQAGSTSTAELSLLSRQACSSYPPDIPAAYIRSREHTESEDLVVRTPRGFGKIIPRLFDIACQSGYRSLVRIILEHFDLPRDQLSLGLHKAVQGGYAAVVKPVLEMGKPDVESKDNGHTPLSWAARGGHDAVAKALLESNAVANSKDVYDQTPLSWAAGNGHEDVVKLLLEKGAELESKDKYERTPLSWAAGNGHEDMVKLLLEKGAELQSEDNNIGRTPLSWAAGNGHEDVVKLLLEKGAELESKDNNSETPLSWAASYGQEAVIKLLIEKGAELESKDKDGQTPLWWAAMIGREAVVRLLIDGGADVNVEDRVGRTALWLAAGGGNEAMVRLLIDRGADVNVKDRIGRTALGLAAAGGYEVVIQLLQFYTRKPSAKRRVTVAPRGQKGNGQNWLKLVKKSPFSAAFDVIFEGLLTGPPPPSVAALQKFHGCFLIHPSVSHVRPPGPLSRHPPPRHCPSILPWAIPILSRPAFKTNSLQRRWASKMCAGAYCGAGRGPKWPFSYLRPHSLHQLPATPNRL
jgi:ankyrin repeat protein